MPDKLRVVLSYVYFPMAIGRYFEAALRRRDDVALTTVGPFFGAMIPWNNWMPLPAKYATPPDVILTQGVVDCPIAFIEGQIEGPVDLWIQVDAGFHLTGRPTSGKNIIIATDPHVLNYDKQRTAADVLYCMQTHYAKGGDQVLPYAYDPIWHAPEEQPQNFDVCLIGLHYPKRNQLVSLLRQRGVQVYYDLGPVFDEARALYNQAPIGLNWSSLQDLTARVFELLGMRRLAIVNDVPDLKRYFEPGRDLIACGTVEEAAEQVSYYLEHPDELQAIAERGHQKVQPHTWDARIEQILTHI